MYAELTVSLRRTWRLVASYLKTTNKLRDTTNKTWASIFGLRGNCYRVYLAFARRQRDQTRLHNLIIYVVLFALLLCKATYRTPKFNNKPLFWHCPFSSHRFRPLYIWLFAEWYTMIRIPRIKKKRNSEFGLRQGRASTSISYTPITHIPDELWVLLAPPSTHRSAPPNHDSEHKSKHINAEPNRRAISAPTGLLMSLFGFVWHQCVIFTQHVPECISNSLTYTRLDCRIWQHRRSADVWIGRTKSPTPFKFGFGSGAGCRRRWRCRYEWWVRSGTWEWVEYVVYLIEMDV